VTRPTTTEIVPLEFEALLDDRIGDLRVLLAGTDVTPERFIKSTIHALAKYPNVRRAPRADVLLAVLECAEMGLEPTGGYGGAHLVTFQTKEGVRVSVITDYRGLIKMAMRTGQVTAVTAELAYEGDAFSYRLGTSPEIDHLPQLDPERRGEPTHVYATAKLGNGDYIFTVMTMAEVMAIKTRSRASSAGPWVTDPGWMIRKTAVRQLFKLHPAVISPAMAKALEREDEAEGSEVIVTPPAAPPSERKQRLVKRLTSSPEDPAAPDDLPDIPPNIPPNIPEPEPPAEAPPEPTPAPEPEPAVEPAPEPPAEEPPAPSAAPAEPAPAVPDEPEEELLAAATDEPATCGDPSPYGDGETCAREPGHSGVHFAVRERATW
jgi:recombination protein RecT